MHKAGFWRTYPGDYADGTAGSAGYLSPAARDRGPAAEEEEEVGVEEGDGPQDGHAPELRRAQHAERGAVHCVWRTVDSGQEQS